MIIEAWTIDGVVQVREYDVDTGTCDSPFVVGEMVDGRVDVTYREAEDGVYSEGGVYFADCSERFESRLLGG